MKIYANKKEAIDNLTEFMRKLDELEQTFWIFPSCDDSCCSIYYEARYYDEKGEVKTHCYHDY